MNWIERFANRLGFARKVAPSAPVKRGNYYESGQTGSRKRSPIPGNQPQDSRKDLTSRSRQQILKLSRYAHRNSGLSVEQRRMMAIYCIGAGRWPKSKAPDLEWRKKAEARFLQLARRPEITGRYNWREVQSLVCQHMESDGEIFALKTFDRFNAPKIQLLETHQISTLTDERKLIFDGIGYDAVGRPVTYYKVRPGGGEPIPLKAQSVIHAFVPGSISSSRFIPEMQHGLLDVQDELEMMSDEKHAVKRLQQEAIVLKSDRESALDDGDMGMDSEAAEIAAGTISETDALEVAEAFGARVQRINRDEEMTAFEFQRPYSTFGEFLDRMERNASGGGIPWEVARDPSKIGGASVRLVTSKAGRYIEERGMTIDDRFCDPVWNYFIGWEIDNGRLEAAEGWNEVEFTKPKKISVDAGRDGNNSRLDIEMGISTWSDELDERGGDFDDWLTRRTQQARQIMTAAGHPESEPIPLWMIYKPGGVSLSGDAQQNTEV